MKYMLLIYNDPHSAPTPGSPEQLAVHDRWMQFSEQLFTSGAAVTGDALQGVETATTVRVRGGDRLTTDGPFAETKEVLGGYYVIDVEGLDQALEIAASMPNIDYGTVEVRPIMDFSG